MILEKELKHKDELIEEINALINENSRLKTILKKVFKEDNMNAVYERVERMEYNECIINNYSGVKEQVQETKIVKEEGIDNNVKQSKVIEIKKEEGVKEEVIETKVNDVDNKGEDNNNQQNIETEMKDKNKDNIIEHKVETEIKKMEARISINGYMRM